LADGLSRGWSAPVAAIYNDDQGAGGAGSDQLSHGSGHPVVQVGTSRRRSL